MTTDTDTTLDTLDFEADWLDGNRQPYSIYVLMGMILADLPAIGKDNQAPAAIGGFHFRGIEDVKNRLNPLLSKYGVFYVPLAQEASETIRMTSTGKEQYAVRLLVRYRFYGPRGDYVDAAMYGEGSDTGDKATQKAATSAEKYLLFETFCINTEDQHRDDVDRNQTEDTVPSLQCARCKEQGADTIPRFPDHRNGGDPEPYRTHLVDVHGYVRLEDGRVSAPPADAPEDTAPTGQPAPAQETPADASTDAPEPASPPADEPASDPAPPADTDDLPAWRAAGYDTIGEADDAISAMKVSGLSKALNDLGLPMSGNKGDLQARLREAYGLNGGDAPAAAAPAKDEPVDPKDVPVENLEQDGYYCPAEGCDVFPFRTQREYEEHWNSTHEQSAGDDAPADGEAVPAAMLEELRTAVAGLRGAAARAYGKYRKEKALPAVDEMSMQQVIDASDYIATL